MAKTISESGRAVEEPPAAKIKDVLGCELVILGAPLYPGAWHRDALVFLGATGRR